MRTQQIVLPFPVSYKKSDTNRDLIGRAYRQDKYATVTVIDICANDAGRVVVERDTDGKSWTMPGWLMRLIFLEERKRAA